MKIKLLLILLTITQIASAQRFIAKNGHVWFYSHTPIEDNEAHNNQTVSILEATTGDFQFSLLIKAFEFKVALMQEHFNENYMESDKFPKASFKGKITNLNEIDFKKDGTYPVKVTGDLTIHGVTQTVSTEGTFEIKKEIITAKSMFKVKPTDYGVVIPQLVENKIAKEMEVHVDVTYSGN